MQSGEPSNKLKASSLVLPQKPVESGYVKGTTRSVVRDLPEPNGVGWRSYQEPWLDTGNEMVTGIVLSVISAMAKQERQTLIDRTLAGLRTAKRNGKILGRPRRAIDWEQVNYRVGKGESVRALARSLNVSHSLLLKGLSV